MNAELLSRTKETLIEEILDEPTKVLIEWAYAFGSTADDRLLDRTRDLIEGVFEDPCRATLASCFVEGCRARSIEFGPPVTLKFVHDLDNPPSSSIAPKKEPEESKPPREPKKRTPKAPKKAAAPKKKQGREKESVEAKVKRLAEAGKTLQSILANCQACGWKVNRADVKVLAEKAGIVFGPTGEPHKFRPAPTVVIEPMDLDLSQVTNVEVHAVAPTSVHPSNFSERLNEDPEIGLDALSDGDNLDDEEEQGEAMTFNVSGGMLDLQKGIVTPPPVLADAEELVVPSTSRILSNEEAKKALDSLPPYVPIDAPTSLMATSTGGSLEYGKQEAIRKEQEFQNEIRDHINRIGVTPAKGRFDPSDALRIIDDLRRGTLDVHIADEQRIDIAIVKTIAEELRGHIDQLNFFSRPSERSEYKRQLLERLKGH